MTGGTGTTAHGGMHGPCRPYPSLEDSTKVSSPSTIQRGTMTPSGPGPDRPAVEVRGALVRGLIDHIARSEGVQGAEDALRKAGHAPKQILPEMWYPRALMQDLLELQAHQSGKPLQAVARQAGRRMAQSSLDGLDDTLCFVPPEHLVERLQSFVRIGDRNAIQLETIGDEIHLKQDPPGGPQVCALFHGIVEGLLDQLRVEGCIADDDIQDVRCRAEGQDRCEYEVVWTAADPG